jgi:Cu2+-exporting ATPase
MEKYNVGGMSCAACSTRVEKAVSKVEGVNSCAVSLLTNSMGVEGTASPESIIKAVEDAGYTASLQGQKKETSSQKEALDALADHETPKLKKRLIASIGFLLVLMYFSMGVTMWHWPAPAFFHNNMLGIGMLEMLLAIVVMIINKRFFVNGFKSLFHLAPNMDALVALGSSAAFGYSLVVLFQMTKQMPSGMHPGFYFESAAMILTLITIGKMLEAMSKGKTTNALKSLIQLSPKMATLERNGEEIQVPVEEVQRGDFFVVRPGENIPVDGVIVEGSAAINESALTGESIPADKTVGDEVSAATINQSGYIKCRAVRVGEDTTLSQIIQTVSDAAATKAPIAKIADKVSGVFVPVVIGLSVLTFIVWMALGQPVGWAIGRAISILVISCPCALGLATPVAIMVGNGLAAKNGIMFKTAESLEETGRIQIVALDKTGTITTGTPQVTDVYPLVDEVTEEALVQLAASLEYKSEHPLAKAIVEEAKTRNLDIDPVQNFEVLAGSGVRGTLQSKALLAGNRAFISKTVSITSKALEIADQAAFLGKTPLFFAADGQLIGIIAVADELKQDSPEAIAQLKHMGIQVIMLSGDNLQTAKAIGKEAGVDHVIAGVTPNGKEAIINKLKTFGKVAMVGDGINDAPALTRADIGIAIGAGTDIAIESADVVLMKSHLREVAEAIRLSRETLKNIHENLFWAFFYNVICIPLAAGAYYYAFGWLLNPMIGAAAMSLSSVCVVSNALRLNLFKIKDSKKDKRIKNAVTLPEELFEEKINQKEGDQNMKTETINIKGMMCEHCEATVKKALEKFPEVENAQVSHEKGTAVVSLSQDIDDEKLKKAIEDKGYTVLGFEH